MQTNEFLVNTDFTQNSGGYIDILRYRFQPYVNTAGAVTAANTLIAAIVSERNNVHTLIGDGITDGPFTIVAAAADDGGKLRFITKELIDSIEASCPFAYGLDTDPTVDWLAIRPVPPKLPGIPKQFRQFVNSVTLVKYTYTANTRTRRLATLDAAYALYAAVESL